MTEKTETLIAEARILIADCRTYNFGLRNADRLAHEIAPRLADALEAATRVPVQGEPNACLDHKPVQHRDGKPPWCNACGRATIPDASDVDAVLNRLDELNNGGISYEVYSELHDLVSAIPAAVPDAATKQAKEELAASLELRAYWRSQAIEARAERDAALAAIERVRAVHAREDHFGPVDPGFPPSSYAWQKDGEVCANCRVTWPCPTVAALDGAPERDREKQLERVAARLREIVYLCGDDLGCQCEEAQDASADLARELSIIAAERPTLTADEVWAIAKAEHDFAGDSDNVGAFVDSLTDALRAAGVAFDERSFIDSGYLLPVEGESK